MCVGVSVGVGDGGRLGGGGGGGGELGGWGALTIFFDICGCNF